MYIYIYAYAYWLKPLNLKNLHVPASSVVPVLVSAGICWLNIESELELDSQVLSGSLYLKLENSLRGSVPELSWAPSHA